MGPIPQGWYRDPAGGALERYFDGAGWTQETRPIQLRRRAPRASVVLEHDPRPVASTGAVEPAGQRTAAAFGSLPAAGLPTSPFRRTAARGSAPAPSPIPDTAAQNPVQPPAVGTSPRRSLAAALGGVVAEQSSQRLLLGTATELVPRSLRTSTGPTPSGWYPDPARGGGLRFFDGTRWTGRTRRAADESVRHLPTAALKLRARVLQAQDDAAVRRGPRIRRSTLVIPRAQSAPSLRTRSRSGSMWGMLSTLLMVVGLLAAAVFAWQLWGTNIENKYQQKHLEKELTSQTANGPYGNVTVTVTTGAAPTAGAAPGAGTGAGGSQHQDPTPPPAGSTTTGTGPSHHTHAPGTSPSSAAPSPETQVHVDPNATGDGSPVGRIRIPAIGLERVFVLGTGEDQLALGPGLWKWGSFPGTPGNTTISGHRTTHGAPFYRLGDLKYGDRIYIDVPGQREAVYEVRGHTIATPFDVHVTQQTAGVRLTLTTCNPVGSAAQRLVIEAELVQGKYVADALPRSAWRLLR